MAGTFADQSIYNPRFLADQCQTLGVRYTAWWGLANGFTNPAGVFPGTGHVLMTRAALNRINFNTLNSLKLTHEPTGTTVTCANLVVTECEAVTPSYPGDINAIFHVRLADVRHLWRFSVVDDAYNMRVTPTGNYRAETTVSGGGTAYTWQEMFAKVWETLPSDYRGTTPTLPAVTQGTPEAFDFYGMTTVDALDHILARIGCTLRLSPSTLTFTVLPLADATAYTRFTAATKALNDRNLRLDDNEGLASNIGRVPAQVKVLFRQQIPTAYGTSPYYSITVTDPNSPAVAGQLAGTTVLLHDDLTANYQGGTLTNTTALTDRANSRASEYFKRVRRMGPVLRRLLYSGAQTTILPGEWVSEVSWFDRGGGSMTEVVQHPDNGEPLRKWPGNRPQDWRETEEVVPDTEYSGDVPTGYSAGKVQRFDASTGTWGDMHDCWIRDADAT